MKKSFFSNSKRFKEKRFYIVLACCVLSITAIAVTTSLKTPDNAPTENKSENVKYNLPEPIEPYSEENEEEIHVQPTDTPQTDFASDIQDEENTNYLPPVKETFESEKLRRIISPVDGDIIFDYSQTPVYFSQTADWRTHEAIDFSADAGSEIHAASDGKIEKISSGIYGNTIIIDHENSMKTLYANLEVKDDIKEGDKVSQGDVIAISASNSLCEKHKTGHVHFEVMIDNKNIDPHEWLK